MGLFDDIDNEVLGTSNNNVNININNNNSLFSDLDLEVEAEEQERQRLANRGFIPMAKRVGNIAKQVPSNLLEAGKQFVKDTYQGGKQELELAKQGEYNPIEAVGAVGYGALQGGANLLEGAWNLAGDIRNLYEGQELTKPTHPLTQGIPNLINKTQLGRDLSDYQNYLQQRYPLATTLSQEVGEELPAMLTGASLAKLGLKANKISKTADKITDVGYGKLAGSSAVAGLGEGLLIDPSSDGTYLTPEERWLNRFTNAGTSSIIAPTLNVATKATLQGIDTVSPYVQQGVDYAKEVTGEIIRNGGNGAKFVADEIVNRLNPNNYEQTIEMIPQETGVGLSQRTEYVPQVKRVYKNPNLQPNTELNVTGEIITPQTQVNQPLLTNTPLLPDNGTGFILGESGDLIQQLAPNVYKKQQAKANKPLQLTDKIYIDKQGVDSLTKDIKNIEYKKGETNNNISEKVARIAPNVAKKQAKPKTIEEQIKYLEERSAKSGGEKTVLGQRYLKQAEELRNSIQQKNETFKNATSEGWGEKRYNLTNKNNDLQGYIEYTNRNNDSVSIDYVHNVSGKDNTGIGTKLINKVVSENPNKIIIWDSVNDEKAKNFKQSYIKKHPELKDKIMTENEYKMFVAQSKKYGYNDVVAYLEFLNGRNNQGQRSGSGSTNTNREYSQQGNDSITGNSGSLGKNATDKEKSGQSSKTETSRTETQRNSEKIQEKSTAEKQVNTEVAKATEEKKAKKEPSKDSIQDVGEFLQGNRKLDTSLTWNDLDEMNDLVRAKNTTKAKIYPAPKFDDLKSEGYSDFGSALIINVYKKMNAKPASGYTGKENEKLYVDMVNDTMKTVKDYIKNNPENFTNEVLAEKTGSVNPYSYHYKYDDSLFNAVFPDKENKKGYNIFRSYPEYNRKALIVGGSKFTEALRIDYHTLKDVSKIIEESKALKDEKTGEKVKKQEWEKTFTVLEPSRWDNRYAVAFKKGKQIIAKFNTKAEAELVAQRAYEKLKQQKENEKSLDSTRKHIERRKDGRDVTAQELKDEFGFRGVNFGNWVNQKERQDFINYTYDSLFDLAELLNLPPKALSLEGQLGIAFGAQGHGGKASAHYIPAFKEINLTKEHGAGSLAHEWWHAVDNYFGNKASNKEFSENWGISLKQKGEVREEVFNALKDLHDQIKTSPLTEEDLAKYAKYHTDRINGNINRYAEHIKNSYRRAKNADELNKIVDDLANNREKYKDYSIEQMNEFEKKFFKLLPENRDTLTNRGEFSWLTGAIRQLARVEELAKGTAKKSEYLKSAEKLDKQEGSRYWAEDTELGARAFSVWLLDKMEKQSILNRFLVRQEHSAMTIDEATFKKLLEGKEDSLDYIHKTPIVTEEKARIFKAFDKLFDTIQTRETDKGIELYSSYDASTAPSEYTLEDFIQYEEPLNSANKVITTLDDLVNWSSELNKLSDFISGVENVEVCLFSKEELEKYGNNFPASYSPVDNIIKVNPKATVWQLAHEIQHAKDYKEAQKSLRGNVAIVSAVIANIGKKLTKDLKRTSIFYKVADYAYRNCLLEKRAYKTQENFERAINGRKTNSAKSLQQNGKDLSRVNRQEKTFNKKPWGFNLYTYERGSEVSEEKTRGNFGSSMGNESRSTNKRVEENIPDDIDEILPKVKKPSDKVFQRIITPISTRLESISPRIKHAVRKFELDSALTENKYAETVKPFIDNLSKMPESDYAKYDLALKNGNVEVINSLNSKYNLTKEYSKIRTLLDEIREKALNVGFNVGYVQDYFPRKVINSAEYLEYLSKNSSFIKEKLAELDPKGTMSNEDKITKINSILKGYNGGITASSSFSKARKVAEITKETNQFYKDSKNALVDYISSMNNAIMVREFFGGENAEVKDLRTSLRKKRGTLKDIQDRTPEEAKSKEIGKAQNRLASLNVQLEALQKKKDKTDEEVSRLEELEDKQTSAKRYVRKLYRETAEQTKTRLIEDKKAEIKELEEELENTASEKNLEDSVGAYVKGLIDVGLISPSQELEVRQILEARFNQRGTHGFWQDLKNIGYIFTMGNPFSTITQIGDFAFTLYKNGAFNTMLGIQKSLSSNKISREDLGINKIAQEFESDSKTSKLVDKVFKIVGLNKIDSLGKESFINASFNRLQNEAKQAINNPNSKEATKFYNYLNEIFGNETFEVMQDLNNGEVTDNVKYLLFSEISDFQPISLAEMPEAYLGSGNGRIFYMLKTYSIKLLDVYRNEVFKQFKKNPKEGLENLVRLTFLVSMLGVGADTIKDFLMGREIDLEETFIDNILKIAMFSKYQLDKSKREGIGRVIWSSIIPPSNVIDDLQKDITDEKFRTGEKGLNELRSTKNIPVLGKFYYWWLGGGIKTKEKEFKTKIKNDLKDVYSGKGGKRELTQIEQRLSKRGYSTKDIQKIKKETMTTFSKPYKDRYVRALENKNKNEVLKIQKELQKTNLSPQKRQEIYTKALKEYLK